MLFTKYTKENCIHECKSNASIEICKCARYFYPREISRSNLIFFSSPLDCFVIFTDGALTKVCSEWFDYKCVMRVENIVTDRSSRIFRRCDCLPTCDSILYSPIFVSTRITKLHDSNDTKSSFKLEFSDSDVLVYRRSLAFGTVTLLSNVGGLLGLFLGVSFLSIIEFFYFFIIRFLNDLWWKRTKLVSDTEQVSTVFS
jgi:acid-sensing ion channel, other